MFAGLASAGVDTLSARSRESSVCADSRWSPPASWNVTAPAAGAAASVATSATAQVALLMASQPKR